MNIRLEEGMDRPVRSSYMDIVEQRTLEDGGYRVTIAANEQIRQPPELDFSGLSTENYAKNPVVMWAHDAVGRSPSGGLPIGRTSKLVKSSEGRIVADFEFLTEDPFSQRVKNAWDKGFLQAASISWLPLEGGPTKDGKWKDSQSELLEWSIVALPADPDALRESQRRMMSSFVGDYSRVEGPDENRDQRGIAATEDGVSRPDLVDIMDLVREVKTALGP